LLGVMVLGVALFKTGELPLIDRDEGRYAEGAREMLASGDWLVPRLFGVPYLEKPPLFFWLTAASCGLVGVGELGARLVSAIAAAAGCSSAQLVLAWVLARAPHAVVIPGTTRVGHLLENCGADAIRLDAATIAALDALLPPGKASGARYPPVTQAENDTEEIGQSA